MDDSHCYGQDESHTMVIFDWANEQSSLRRKLGTATRTRWASIRFFATIDRIDELKVPVTPREGEDEAESCCYTIVS